MRTRIAGFVFVVAVVALVATACGGEGAATHFSLPHKNSQPAGITSGPDGNIWFTQFSGGRIGRVNPAGKIDEYQIPTERAGPFDITTGPDGNLWFTEFSANKIGRITPAGRDQGVPAAAREERPVRHHHRARRQPVVRPPEDATRSPG